MRYYHCSAVEHPIGSLLTGPATRGAVSRWSGVEPTYEPERVYLFVGDGDPQILSDNGTSLEPQIVYEVQPQGELRSNHTGGMWDSVSCGSAVVVACVYRPPPAG